MFRPLPSAEDSADSDGEELQKMKQMMSYHVVSFGLIVGLLRLAKTVAENMGYNS
ncbi:hypothetical protein Ocin01_02979 [Orchesella cincta]|uniref:Uncharacterized protein n=1 Tax=Orchesella cincta TaxID=48709 RepID=A0A1D2NEN1_ORCCI|nr:hypothetical protein Ocin01_02979 [Orchesella cincta]